RRLVPRLRERAHQVRGMRRADLSALRRTSPHRQRDRVSGVFCEERTSRKRGITMTLTTTEAAKLYGVSQRTVQRWATRDGAPHKRNHQLGRIVFCEAELEDWLARRGWLNNKKAGATKL